MGNDDDDTCVNLNDTSTSTNANKNFPSSSFRINERYARDYDARKRREELTKHSQCHGQDDSSVVSESSSESEDEEGDFLTPQLDVQILKTLQALRRGDAQVYDQNVAFFDDGKRGEEGAEGYNSKKKTKPKRYKDVVREHILEQMEEEDNDDAGGENHEDRHSHDNNLAYDQEQRDIRRAFLESTRDSDNEESNGVRGSDNDNNDDDIWVKPKVKRIHHSDIDEEAKKLWEQELLQSSAYNSSDKNNNGTLQKNTALVDPKGEVQDGERFLMEFMTRRKWMESDESSDRNGAKILGARLLNNEGEDDDDEQSLQDLERTDDFESRYNFRFEEAAADLDGATLSSSAGAGASHSIIHYARYSNQSSASHAPGDDKVLRRKDESRQRRRAARRERKLAERRAKEERLRRLKNARREELEERMERVRSVLGTGGRRMGGNGSESEAGGTEAVTPALGCAEENMILQLMEGDYDPEKFERVMASAYDEEYYQAEEKVWKSEKDVQRDMIVAAEVGDDFVGYAEGEEEESGHAVLGSEEMHEHSDVEDDQDGYDAENHPNREEQDGRENNVAQQPKTIDQKLQTKVQDELYKLDYEDIIGDMPTRFKYRSVAPNNYGLSTEEIFFSRDSTLKQFVSLKKMAPYIREEEEFRPGTKQRKRFRKMVKMEKESEEKDPGGGAPVCVSGVCLTGTASKEAEVINSVDGGDTRKKKRRRQKKGRHKVSSVKDVGFNNDAFAAIPETAKINSESEEKEEPKKKKSQYDSAAVTEKKKQRKKKKKQKQTVEGVPGARLAAYGI